MVHDHEKWIDRVKLFACVLVAAGHFFMSMIAPGILQETSLYRWFIDTVYYFHVPLFFLCSGYLHQKKGQSSFPAWKQNVFKKAVTLGIPYFTFSLATWGLKAVFSGVVNNRNEALLPVLFAAPTAPYWFLYALFFLFLVTPVFRSKRSATVGLLLALVMRFIWIYAGDAIAVYAVSALLANELWFVLGMWMAEFEIPERLRHGSAGIAGFCCGALFLIGSVAIPPASPHREILSVLMGVLGCAATIMIVIATEGKRNPLDPLSGYTMPIFLMHTICAAGLRGVLLKLGIVSPVVHVVLGLAGSFAGPILAITIMRKAKLDILVYPAKYITLSAQGGQENHV